MLIKHVIDEFHSKDATVLEFNPATVETRILRKKRLQYEIYKSLLNSTDMLSKCILSDTWMKTDQRQLNGSRKKGAAKTARQIHIQVITVPVLSCFFHRSLTTLLPKVKAKFLDKHYVLYKSQIWHTVGD